MTDTTSMRDRRATKLRLALNETHPDSKYGAVPALDHYDAAEAYRAYDDGSLEAVPAELAAYIDHNQRQWF